MGCGRNAIAGPTVETTGGCGKICRLRSICGQIRPIEPMGPSHAMRWRHAWFGNHDATSQGNPVDRVLRAGPDPAGIGGLRAAVRSVPRRWSREVRGLRRLRTDSRPALPQLRVGAQAALQNQAIEAPRRGAAASARGHAGLSQVPPRAAATGVLAARRARIPGLSFGRRASLRRDSDLGIDPIGGRDNALPSSEGETKRSQNRGYSFELGLHATEAGADRRSPAAQQSAHFRGRKAARGQRRPLALSLATSLLDAAGSLLEQLIASRGS